MASAEEGDPDAQYDLGFRYSFGTSVPNNHATSAHWFRAAAAQGHAGAQVWLAMKYEIGGLGVPQDYSQALYWYRQAAEQGDAAAQYSLGNLYFEGRGVRRDDAKAVLWFERAAGQGNTTAQLYLGVMLANGRGVPQDEYAAAQWFRRVAEMEPDVSEDEDRTRWVWLIYGQDQAQYNLGRLYAEGGGIPQDESVAVHWFRRAAELGHTEAQFALGVMYANGRGVLKDSVLAYMWFNIAGANGNERARTARDVLEEDLTRAEIGRATQLARACMSSNYETCQP